MSGDQGLEYAKMAVIEALPLSRFAPQGGEELLHSMAGASIVQIGSTDEDGIEGGGLIIDYMPWGTSEVKRVVFAFNECGLWVEWEGSVRLASSPA